MQGNPELLRMLAEIDPRKPYGAPLCDALWRLTVNPTIEAVCLYLDPKIREISVYMTQRGPRETAHPNEWHCPGSVMRPGEDFKDVLARLAKNEFGGGEIISSQFVTKINHPGELRGHMLSLVYLCVLGVIGLDPDGKWFPVSRLPEKTVETHRYRIIPAALGAFVAENTNICW